MTLVPCALSTVRTQSKEKSLALWAWSSKLSYTNSYYTIMKSIDQTWSETIRDPHLEALSRSGWEKHALLRPLLSYRSIMVKGIYLPFQSPHLTAGIRMIRVSRRSGGWRSIRPGGDTDLVSELLWTSTLPLYLRCGRNLPASWKAVNPIAWCCGLLCITITWTGFQLKLVSLAMQKVVVRCHKMWGQPHSLQNLLEALTMLHNHGLFRFQHKRCNTRRQL